MYSKFIKIYDFLVKRSHIQCRSGEGSVKLELFGLKRVHILFILL